MSQNGDAAAEQAPAETPAEAPTSAPPAPVIQLHTAGLTPDQYRFLTAGLAGGRVQHLRGSSHLEQWDVRRHLIRVFGFGGFDVDTKALVLVREIEHAPGTVIRKDNQGKEYANDRTIWTVVYRAELRLTIKDRHGREIAHWEDCASGDSCNQPSLGDAHDQAMKTSVSQALKRCAVNLGDQFGLSLYNGGNRAPVVVGSFVAPGGLEQKYAAAAAVAETETVERDPEATDADAAEPASDTAARQVAAGEGGVLADFERRIKAATTNTELLEVWREAKALKDAGQLLPEQGRKLNALFEQQGQAIESKKGQVA